MSALTAQDIAKARHKRLSAIRLGGVVVAMVGVAIAADKVALPHWLGLLLILIGAFDVLVFPLMLIRRWKKEDK
jgi:drug/metabolite transporter (DMT)-like permease